MKIPVMLVDDHAAVRQMLAVVLEREGAYSICGEARTGLEALKLAGRVRPKVMIMDLMLEEVSGLEVLRRVRTELPATRVLLFSGTQTRELIIEALQARPHGFIHKQDSLETFREGLRTVATGGSYFTPLATDLFDETRAGRSGWDELTSRERAVLQMIAEGKANKVIAACLGCAQKTVEHHRAHLMQKLGLHDVASLTRCAVRRGLVSLG